MRERRSLNSWTADFVFVFVSCMMTVLHMAELHYTIMQNAKNYRHTMCRELLKCYSRYSQALHEDGVGRIKCKVVCVPRK